MHQITEQLSLKLIERQDADALYALVDANRDHLREWLGWVDGATGPEGYRDEMIPAWLKQYADGDGFACGIYYDGTIVGMISLHGINHQLRATSIGYYVTGDGRGKDLMIEVVRFVTEYCFMNLGLNRVVIECAAGNTRSQRIPERLGFVKEGTLRSAERLYGKFHDIIVYAMLAEDWQPAVAQIERMEVGDNR